MRSTTQRLAAAALFFASAGFAFAQDNAALIEMLARKGIITDQEAEDLRADVAKDNSAGMVSTAKGNFLDKITITGRLQGQYVNLNTNIDGTAADPAANSHFFLRRVYLGVKANMFQGWSGYVNYDFAGSTFDAAQITWQLNPELSFDFGFRKAPIGYDEWMTSSSSIKAIERSAVTRYFVEGNNGRRLGAGSYRQGVFLNGGNLKSGFSYQLAVTNPERDESSSGAAGVGSVGNNNFAYWGYAGYTAKTSTGSWRVGASAGFLPDQGGKTLGRGSDLMVGDIFGSYTVGKFTIEGEYYVSDNENGAGTNLDSKSWGYWIQPSYLMGAWEAVVRYGYVDSDGRGVNLSDSIRSAPGGGTMDKLTELFAGFNYYLRGNDVKLQAGYVWGKSEDTVTGGTAHAETEGVRTQLQVNF